MKEKIIYWLKWIGVLPIAILGMSLGYFIIYLFGVISNFWMAPLWTIKIPSNIISGAAFVYLGAAIAPEGKKIVSIVLSTIFICFFIVNVSIAYEDSFEVMDFWVWLFYGLFAVAGAIITTIYIYRKDDSIEENDISKKCNRKILNSFSEYDNDDFIFLFINKKKTLDYSALTIQKEWENLSSKVSNNDREIGLDAVFKVLEYEVSSGMVDKVKDIKSNICKQLDKILNDNDLQNAYDYFFRYAILYMLYKYSLHNAKMKKMEQYRPIEKDGIIFMYGKFDVSDYIGTNSVCGFKLGDNFDSCLKKLKNWDMEYDLSVSHTIYIHKCEISTFDADMVILFGDDNLIKRIDLYFPFDNKYNIEKEYGEVFDSMKKNLGNPKCMRNKFREIVFGEKMRTSLWLLDNNRFQLFMVDYPKQNRKLIVIRMDRNSL